MDTSMICPLMARNPAWRRAASKRANSTSMAGLSSIRARQRLAEGPDRVRIRHRVAEPEPEEAHEGEPVLDQERGALVLEAIARLQDENLEHEHVIEERAAALGAVRARHRPDKIRPEQRDVHE